MTAHANVVLLLRMFFLCPVDFIHDFITWSAVFCPDAMFSAADLYESPACVIAVKQDLLFGRVWENFVVISFTVLSS